MDGTLATQSMSATGPQNGGAARESAADNAADKGGAPVTRNGGIANPGTRRAAGDDVTSPALADGCIAANGDVSS